MPRTKKYIGIELDGAIFDDGIAENLAAAINEGLEETGDQAAGVLAGFISQSGFVKTGGFLSGVDSQMRIREGQVGYAKVGVFSGAWPEANRPTREWFERGRRGGVQMRKGLGGFSKTQRRVGDFSYANIEKHVEEALN
jgi:hypothetical protein